MLENENSNVFCKQRALGRKGNGQSIFLEISDFGSKLRNESEVG